MRSDVSHSFPRISQQMTRLISRRRIVFICGALAIVFAANPARLSGQATGDWTEFHRTNMERWNPYETVLSASNVGSLGVKWN